MTIYTTTLMACLLSLLSVTTSAVGDDAKDEPIGDIIEKFSKAWNEATWEPKATARRSGYMRPPDDGGWKTRMAALQNIAKRGDTATEDLQKALGQGGDAERALAAQAAGFADCQKLRGDLARIAESDSDPVVRLYAIDSLGRLGKPAQAELYRRLLESEKNRDVQMHLKYALAREDKGLDNSIRKSLLEWDASRVDSAKLGMTAPDFELPSLSGERVKLSSFRGKKSVVLVFVYGDT